MSLIDDIREAMLSKLVVTHSPTPDQTTEINIDPITHVEWIPIRFTVQNTSDWTFRNVWIKYSNADAVHTGFLNHTRDWEPDWVCEEEFKPGATYSAGYNIQLFSPSNMVNYGVVTVWADVDIVEVFQRLNFELLCHTKLKFPGSPGPKPLRTPVVYAAAPDPRREFQPAA